MKIPVRPQAHQVYDAIEKVPSGRFRKMDSSFFDTDAVIPSLAQSFEEFGLSDKILRALKKMNFQVPTDVQSKVIPIALQGRDVCASSTTGSGKTASFLVPTIERLLRRFPEQQCIRCIILSPTRELAQQTYQVLGQLIRYTTLSAMLVVGGILGPKEEEERLMRKPDIIVATPGRLVDHLKNFKKLDFDTVEVLILDEADRLLDEGFMPQIEAIVHGLPEKRQALLVTATMTSSVSKLSELALHNPVRVALDEVLVSDNLTQEFVRVSRATRKSSLIAICSRLCTKKTVIFFHQKKTCHKMFLAFKAIGMPAVELHGDMTQTKRYEALASFSMGHVEFLLASDVAARGLDISGVENVINYNMPKRISHYIHRVGRTARIGHSGRAISLIGEEEREIMKEIIERSQNPVHKRTIPEDVLEKCQQELEAVFEEVKQMESQENQERALEFADKALQRVKDIAYSEEAVVRKQRAYIDKEKRGKMHVDKIGSKITKMRKLKELNVIPKEDKKDKKDKNDKPGKDAKGKKKGHK